MAKRQRIKYKEVIKTMKKDVKVKQIVVRFDAHSYDRISEFAETEHRGLGEFVRHAALFYIEQFDDRKVEFNRRA